MADNTNYHNTVWDENFMAIKFYGLPLNYLNEKFTDFNFTEAQFRTQCHGNI